MQDSPTSPYNSSDEDEGSVVANCDGMEQLWANRDQWTGDEPSIMAPTSLFDNDFRFERLPPTVHYLDDCPTPFVSQTNGVKRRRADEDVSYMRPSHGTDVVQDITLRPHSKYLKREQIATPAPFSSQAPHERRELDLSYVDRALEQVARQRGETTIPPKQEFDQDWKQMRNTPRMGVWY